MSSYEISKSSLLSLKAEILRKQEDLTKAKLENVQKLKTLKKKALELKNKGVEERQLKDLDDEERDLLKLSKSKLEAKSKLYDKLSGNPQDDVTRHYLVRFENKQKVPDQFDGDKDEVPDLPIESEDEENHFSDYYDEDIDPSEEWVEYTDCLGRTRKCLRKDLEYVKSRDEKVRILTGKQHQTNDETNTTNTCDNEEGQSEAGIKESDTTNEESEMISGDMRRESLRKQWEREEEELRNKTDIHYQNVLFSEARQHGVGYYGFSKDEEERAKQQEALKRLRLETQQQQKKAQDLKALRDKQMAARMKAARNRKRARLGLPPEEDEPPQSPEPSEESEEEQKKKEEKEKLERDEKLLTEARKRHVRPWDVGKEGVTEFYQMSQHEWNEKKREERPKEFAPTIAYNKRAFNSMRSLESDTRENDKSLRFTSINKGNLRNLNRYKQSKTDEYEPLPTEDSFDDNDCLMKDYMQSNTFTTSQKTTSKKPSYEPEDPIISEGVEDNFNKMKPVPIRNEVDETEFDDSLLADYQKCMQNQVPDKEDRARRKGAEIAPPPTFEYFGPTETKKVKHSFGQINIEQSIQAGLQFLRSQAEQKSRPG